MSKREGNRPDRRFLVNAGSTVEQRTELAGRVTYVGSSNHKLHPNDYGFVPPTNPRPTKSVCDDVNPVNLRQAQHLFSEGIRRGMYSAPKESGLPKYVWCVDDDGNVWEAKTRPEHENTYHGYRLGDNESGMREYILREWRNR